MKTFREFLTEEDGLEVIEIAIILAIALGLVVVFKNKLQEIWTNTIAPGLDTTNLNTKIE